MPALQPQQETITLEQYEALPEEKSLKQISRGDPRKKSIANKPPI